MHAANLNFFKKIKNSLTFSAAGLIGKKKPVPCTELAGSGKKNWFCTEPAGSGKKPTGSVQNRSEAVQGVGLGSEPVKPVGFTGSGSVLVTLIWTIRRKKVW
jgi:hypothetical protein